MAVRKVIHIDEEACTGCGLCVNACHEGAIGLVNGKARLMRDDYCDGLGDCLPSCPAGAITFVEREAADYDEAAVVANKMRIAKEQAAAEAGKIGFQCPGSAVREFKRDAEDDAGANVGAGADNAAAGVDSGAADSEVVDAAGNATNGLTSETVPSQISTWPIQIKLVPPNMPAFDGCDLLIAADCTAFAYGNFHQDFMRNRVCIIGCPKLDAIDYAEKLEQIFTQNDIRSVTLTRMEVPCCGGLEMAAQRALKASGKAAASGIMRALKKNDDVIPFEIVTFSLDGRIL